MIETHWHRSLTVQTTTWSPGDYLFRLDSSAGHQRFVPLTVRSASAAGRVVLINGVTTWQAYNLWGCCDLYMGSDGGFQSRSRAVSFDRPYLEEDGAAEFIERELGVVAQAERLGLSLDYLTDIDLARDHVLRGATAVITLGHDEYWSPHMRAVVTRARGAGSNLAFLGANAVFRRIRYEDSHLGSHRIEVNYKVASEDPLYGRDNSRVTADWPSPPDARPESSLIGEQYGCFPGRTRVAGYVNRPKSWLFAHTGVTKGMALPGLIGPEIDSIQNRYPHPAGVKAILRSPVHCPSGYPAYQDSTIYTAKSGALVFDAGTIDWSCGVKGGCHVSGPTHRVVRQVTRNLLIRFSAIRDQ